MPKIKIFINHKVSVRIAVHHEQMWQTLSALATCEFRHKITVMGLVTSSLAQKMLSVYRCVNNVDNLTWCIMNKAKNRFLILGLLLSPLMGWAGQPLPEIEKLVKDHVQQALDQFYEHQGDFNVQVSNLDPRLNLEQCLEPLKADLEFGRINQQHLTIKVSCETPKRWAIRVPVKVQHFKEIALTTQNLQKEQLITPNDVKLVRTDISAVSEGYYASVDELIGLVATKPIAANAMVLHHMVKQPLLIRRGENVKILVKAPGLTIEGSGIAQTDGIKGQTIRVKNSRSNRIVEATVQEAGLAVVTL